MFSTMDQIRVVNLMVVARLQRGQKLNTRQHKFSIVDASSTWFLSRGSFERAFKGESREQTMVSLDELVGASLRGEMPDDGERSAFVELLLRVERGLCNLVMTYSGDVTTVACLSLLLDNIECYVAKNGTNDQLHRFKNMRVRESDFLHLVEEEVSP